MTINTDYAQYKALAERDAYLEDVLNGVISDVKTNLSTNNLEDLQKQDIHEK
jgi:hypothetical protein